MQESRFINDKEIVHNSKQIIDNEQTILSFLTLSIMLHNKLNLINNRYNKEIKKFIETGNYKKNLLINHNSENIDMYYIIYNENCNEEINLNNILIYLEYYVNQENCYLNYLTIRSDLINLNPILFQIISSLEKMIYFKYSNLKYINININLEYINILKPILLKLSYIQYDLYFFKKKIS